MTTIVSHFHVFFTIGVGVEVIIICQGTSAKIYLASDTPLLRQDTRHRILAPMTPGAFYGWLSYALAPGASGGALPYTFPSGRY